MKLSEIESEIETLLIDCLVRINDYSPQLKKDLLKLNILDLARKVNKDIQLYQEKVSTDTQNAYDSGYEEQLIKLEQDIRTHIKTEFQLKLYSENLESRIDYLEKDVDRLHKEKKEKDTIIDQLEKVIFYI
jgi:hypothetical protein